MENSNIAQNIEVGTEIVLSNIIDTTEYEEIKEGEVNE